MKTRRRTLNDAQTQPQTRTQRHWDACPEVETDPERMGGARTFRGTRVPVATVYDHLAGGMSIKEIVEQFPSVHERQILTVLQHDANTLTEDDEGTPIGLREHLLARRIDTIQRRHQVCRHAHHQRTR